MTKTKKRIMWIIIAIALVVAIVGGSVAIWYFHIPKDKMYSIKRIDTTKEDGHIKVGVISDIQLPQANLYPWDLVQVTNGGGHMIQAMKYFERQNVDMIVFNGDVVNAPDPYCYKQFTDGLKYAEEEIFGKNGKPLPEIVYPMGNHEFFGANCETLFYRSTGLPLNARTIIKGYSFISVSNSPTTASDKKLTDNDSMMTNPDGSSYCDGAYKEDRIAFLKTELKNARDESPNKPIFVFLHMPIGTDVVGGHWATPQHKEICDILKDYPEALVFTSHSHFPIMDERSIVQDDFTYINTGSASYFDLDFLTPNQMPNPNSEKELFDKLLSGELDAYDYKVDGKDYHIRYDNKDFLVNSEFLGIDSGMDIPLRNHVNHGYLIDVDTNNSHVQLDTVNFTYGTSVSSLGMDSFTKDSFTRTREQLKNNSPKPTFDASAKFAASVLPDGNVELKFDTADNTVVKYYTYTIKDREDGSELYIRFFAKNYYLAMTSHMVENNILYTKNAHNNNYTFKNGHTYDIELRAINCFNKASEPIKTSFTLA